MRRRIILSVLLSLSCLSLSACGSRHAGPSSVRQVSDPPLLVPWKRVGDIALGEPKSRVEQEYGSEGHGFHVVQRYGGPPGPVDVEGYYLLHGGSVAVTFYGDRVGRIGFDTPYYRTKSGFGVGSKIPLGACHKVATDPCQHRWRGFIYNPTLKEDPCQCWVKIGIGEQSLPITGLNFGKPWFFVYLRHGRVDGFYFALNYSD